MSNILGFNEFINEKAVSGEWVTFIELKKKGKKLHKVHKSHRASTMAFNKLRTELTKDDVESVGRMTKKEWDRDEAPYAVKEGKVTWDGLINMINEAKFYRIDPNVRDNELYSSYLNIKSFYESLTNGNDVDLKVLDSIIKNLQKVKKSIKGFNSPDEVMGTVYETVSPINEATLKAIHNMLFRNKGMKDAIKKENSSTIRKAIEDEGISTKGISDDEIIQIAKDLMNESVSLSEATLQEIDKKVQKFVIKNANDYDYSNQDSAFQIYLSLKKLYPRLIKEAVNESHFKIGDKVTCKASGKTGEVVKLDKSDGGDDEKYYTVKVDGGKEMKYSPNELELVEYMNEKYVKFSGNTARDLKKALYKANRKNPEEVIIYTSTDESPYSISIDDLDDDLTADVVTLYSDDGDSIESEVFDIIRLEVI